MRRIRKVVVLGGNGVMATGASAVVAAAGIPAVLLARTAERAEAGKARAQQLATTMCGSGAVRAHAPHPIHAGTYGDDAGSALADADLVLEAVSEDLAIKHEVLSLVDRLCAASTIIGTVTSGLSIATLCADRSQEFRRNFLGVHLFNPPTLIRGCELIAHPRTDPGVIALVRDFLANKLGREVVETSDTPGFAGNRLGFKVLNEVAQLAEEHGVLFMDRLVGPQTGRALAPLATIDLVGWDVHKAIVDNLWALTADLAHDQFKLPDYMQRGIDRGQLGRKTRDKGGFYRLEGKGPQAKQFVLDPSTGDYLPEADALRGHELPGFVDVMTKAVRDGRRGGAIEIMCSATGKPAELLRRVVLGYISYGLGLVGTVVERPRDIDRIMGFGFNWAPPGMLVDAIGPSRTADLLAKAKLPVPRAVEDAARTGRPICDEPRLDVTRLFAA
ncbi:MAG: 3-hydroxyacyl-CoA dehydrogenase family protein [Kofleriaceae bacterium]